MSPRRAVIGLMAIAGALAGCPSGAAAATARGYTITRSTDRIVVSRDG